MKNKNYCLLHYFVEQFVDDQFYTYDQFLSFRTLTDRKRRITFVRLKYEIDTDYL